MFLLLRIAGRLLPLSFGFQITAVGLFAVKKIEREGLKIIEVEIWS
jgi:predicted nuclease with RNAse H fold